MRPHAIPVVITPPCGQALTDADAPVATHRIDSQQVDAAVRRAFATGRQTAADEAWELKEAQVMAARSKGGRNKGKANITRDAAICHAHDRGMRLLLIANDTKIFPGIDPSDLVARQRRVYVVKNVLKKRARLHKTG